MGGTGRQTGRAARLPVTALCIWTCALGCGEHNVPLVLPDASPDGAKNSTDAATTCPLLGPLVCADLNYLDECTTAGARPTTRQCSAQCVSAPMPHCGTIAPINVGAFVPSINDPITTSTKRTS